MSANTVFLWDVLAISRSWLPLKTTASMKFAFVLMATSTE